MSGTEIALNSDDIVDAGEAHHKAGRLREAEAHYRKALEIDPGHPGALFYLAHIAYDDGRLPFATQLTEELLRGEPNDAEAWHLLGLIALKENNFVKAQEYFKKTLAIQPAYLQAHYHLGTAHTKQNNFDDALASFQKAVSLNPMFSEAHCSIGSILKIQNRFEEALKSLQRALHLKADFDLAYALIGEILLSQDRPDEAINNFKTAIENNVRNSLIYAGLGTAYLSKKQFSDAITNFERAIALDPQCFTAQFNLGNALFKQGKFREAIISFQQALTVNSQDARLLENLATALYSVGEIENAAEIYRQWLAQEPENPIARHHLAACIGEKIPTRAEDAYVEYTFDTFAETFDATLAGINYRGPELITDALQRQCGIARKQFVILDAGCGTGLCGPLIAEYAAQLIGVDLSAGMLAKAKARNVYDKLVKAELTAYLESQDAAFDVILSADTLIYFGAIENLFVAARKALRKDGLLFLTAEALIGDSDELTYHLNPHGRYSHSAAYLRHALANAGFTICSLETTTLRYEHGVAVPGFILSCRAESVTVEKTPTAADPISYHAQIAAGQELKDAETWYSSGESALNAGNLPEAQKCFEKMLSINPRHALSHYNLGNIFGHKGDLKSAFESFRQAVTFDPQFAEAHCAIGSIFKMQNRLQEALASFRDATRINPNFEWAYAVIGEILLAEKRSDEAIENFRQAIDNNINSAQIYAGLGTAYYGKKQHIEAIASFERALALDPNNYVALSNLGFILKLGGRTSEAEALFQRALVLNPRDTKLLERFADTLYKLGKIDSAAEIYRQWVVLEPNNPVARHHLAACAGEKVPTRAADAYVEHTFDDFSENFDEVLGKLNYRGPELLAAALQRQCGTPRKQFAILDAGCGTGLCGPMLKEYATHLTGVDLSAGMMEKAKLRNVYDELIKAELTAYLQSKNSAYDIILSGDTLNYFGELNSLLLAARQAMRDGGYLFFTTEAASPKDIDDQSKPTYHLNPHGRYSHSEVYLKRVLSEAGFTVVGFETAILRVEIQRPVQSYVVSCRVGQQPMQLKEKFSTSMSFKL